MIICFFGGLGQNAAAHRVEQLKFYFEEAAAFGDLGCDVFVFGALFPFLFFFVVIINTVDTFVSY